MDSRLFKLLAVVGLVVALAVDARLDAVVAREWGMMRLGILNGLFFALEEAPVAVWAGVDL